MTEFIRMENHISDSPSDGVSFHKTTTGWFPRVEPVSKLRLSWSPSPVYADFLGPWHATTIRRGENVTHDPDSEQLADGVLSVADRRFRPHRGGAW